MARQDDNPKFKIYGRADEEVAIIKKKVELLKTANADKIANPHAREDKKLGNALPAYTRHFRAIEHLRAEDLDPAV